MNEITKAILDDYNAQIEATGAVMKYFIEKRRRFMEKNNITDDKKEGMSMNEFIKELANSYGYESFNDMSDAEKYAALTIWRDHMKSILEE
jgi:hypothetical protein|nr:MAG TPA: hypothetical protein [Caudoviricetes sp.]